MTIASLTFTTPIQVSVQAGDLILYCNPTTTANFSTASQSDVVAIGPCLSVSADRLSMTVEHDASVVLPLPTSFILFSKDKYSNPSGLLGYFAEVCFKNNSTTEAELFGINADAFISSK